MFKKREIITIILIAFAISVIATIILIFMYESSTAQNQMMSMFELLKTNIETAGLTGYIWLWRGSFISIFFSVMAGCIIYKLTSAYQLHK